MNENDARREGEWMEEEIVKQAMLGASLAEMAAYHEVSEQWLLRNFGRQIAKAWARRNIHIRGALTKAALHGNIQALKRVTELERKSNDENAKSF